MQSHTQHLTWRDLFPLSVSKKCNETALAPGWHCSHLGLAKTTTSEEKETAGKCSQPPEEKLLMSLAVTSELLSLSDTMRAVWKTWMGRRVTFFRVSITASRTLSFWWSTAALIRNSPIQGLRRSSAPAEETMDGAEGGGRPRRIASKNTPDVAFLHGPRELKRKKTEEKTQQLFLVWFTACFYPELRQRWTHAFIGRWIAPFPFLDPHRRPLKVIKPFNVFLLCKLPSDWGEPVI